MQETKTAFVILLGENEESSDNNCEAELNQYFTEKVVSRETNPLQSCLCWRTCLCTYPLEIQLTCEFLAALKSSIQQACKHTCSVILVL